MLNVALALEPFDDAGLSGEGLVARLAWLRDVVGPRLERYMGYYRNSTSELASTLPCAMTTSFAVRPFRQYQELGLPARITGFRRAADGAAVATGTIDIQRKEVVIENDIAWRMNTLVDFAAGRMPAIISMAKNPATQKRLTTAIQSILDAGDGLTMLQKLVLEGVISGSAWVHLRPTTELLQRLAVLAAKAITTLNTSNSAEGGGTPATAPDPDNASKEAPGDLGGRESLNVSRWLRLKIVETSRVCPLPAAGDSSSDDSPGYVAMLLDQRDSNANAAGNAVGLLQRVRSWLVRPSLAARPADLSFDLFGPTHWQRYVCGNLSEQGPNLLGIVPFVRFENQPDPASGTRVGAAGSAAVDTGMSDVEPLIGLQDELNTRLSDRAYRVTMTSFRMYLGRGIEDFLKRPVGPGQMWSTDNAQATVEAFGGDSSAPSEDSHINEVREAIDKISGVSPVAAGLIRGKLGNLTSAVALRLTLIAMLGRTDRKRAALTQTLSTVVRNVLAILDRAGVLASAPEDRGIDVNWPTALPESDLDRLQEAQAKLAIGVPRDVVLSELGYGEVAGKAAAADAGNAAAA